MLLFSTQCVIVLCEFIFNISDISWIFYWAFCSVRYICLSIIFIHIFYRHLIFYFISKYNFQTSGHIQEMGFINKYYKMFEFMSFIPWILYINFGFHVYFEVMFITGSWPYLVKPKLNTNGSFSFSVHSISTFSNIQRQGFPVNITSACFSLISFFQYNRTSNECYKECYECKKVIFL